MLFRSIEGLEKGRQVGENLFVLDVRGCILNQVLYFIGQGIPVIAYTEDGNYVYLSGYDQYNVTIFNPSTNETKKMGLNDGSAYFEALGNDFICAVRTE